MVKAKFFPSGYGESAGNFWVRSIWTTIPETKSVAKTKVNNNLNFVRGYFFIERN
jgi:hypothetical protein